MSNEIQVGSQAPLQSLEVYDRISNPMEAVKVLGQSIFKSGLFGCDRPEQGEVLAMQCLAERKSPLELARTYHFIQGQLAIRADALLAKYQAMGGKVEWKERTDTRVVAVFSIKGGSAAEIVADIGEYKANGVAYKTDGKTLKDNWARWPRRMLTARAISEGVRLIAPECCFGAYVAEEMDVSPRKVIKVKAEPATVRELIGDRDEAAAVAALVKAGYLSEGQGIDDIDPETERKILNFPSAFLSAAYGI